MSLGSPIVISGDLQNCSRLEDAVDMDGRIKECLINGGFSKLFPVQEAVLRYSRQPNDLLVCAPTGSGKTLAYLLPVLQDLSTRKVARLRALVIVPGRELALQIFNIVESLAAAVGLKAALSVGQASFTQESKKLNNLDILIATPGRLLDHLERTGNFTLQHVKWLIFDEADRLLEGFTQDWLPVVLDALTSTGPDSAGYRTFRRSDSCPWDSPRWITPIRKLLFSATLTRNPAKLVTLNLKSPTYLLVSSSSSTAFGNDSPNNLYALPSELSEYLWVGEEDRKAIPLLYLLKSNSLTRSLCFTKSVSSTLKLKLLLGTCLPDKSIEAFSADLSPLDRQATLTNFNDGLIDLLICSDAAARGLDLLNVEAVINYDAPRHVKTYIHRVGRTARAGNRGIAYTILATKEAYHFKEMHNKLKGHCGNGDDQTRMLRIDNESFRDCKNLLQGSLEGLQSSN